MEKKFYVYTHRRSTDGSVFYIGKGHNRRAWSKTRTNPHWHNTVKKNGYTVHIVMRFASEDCAFSFERALIKHYGRENLCNMTDGGEGVTDKSGEVSKKLRAANLGKKHSIATKGKISLAKSNPTDETREKLRQARLGKTLSDKTKEKISLAGMGRKISEHQKKCPTHIQHWKKALGCFNRKDA